MIDIEIALVNLEKRKNFFTFFLLNYRDLVSFH